MEDRLHLTFATERPFKGRIFVKVFDCCRRMFSSESCAFKGMIDTAECVTNYAENTNSSVEFSLINGECNMRRTRMVSSRLFSRAGFKVVVLAARARALAASFTVERSATLTHPLVRSLARSLERARARLSLNSRVANTARARALKLSPSPPPPIDTPRTWRRRLENLVTQIMNSARWQRVYEQASARLVSVGILDARANATKRNKRANNSICTHFFVLVARSARRSKHQTGARPLELVRNPVARLRIVFFRRAHAAKGKLAVERSLTTLDEAAPASLDPPRQRDSQCARARSKANAKKQS